MTQDPDLPVAVDARAAPVHLAFRPATRSPTSTPAPPRALRARRPTAATLQDERNERFADLQEMLYANSRGGDDTARCCWCCRAWTPRAKAASSNTLSERRIRRVSATQLSVCRPRRSASTTTCGGSEARCRLPGHIGVFDRSHYEDVLMVRVHNLVPPEVWGTRYDEINTFEKKLVDGGTTIVKVAMFVSLEEQKKRLAERLERPDKYWKYNPRTSTSACSGRPTRRPTRRAGPDVDRLRTVARCAVRQKWYSRLGITELLIEALKRSTCPGRQQISTSRPRRSGSPRPNVALDRGELTHVGDPAVEEVGTPGQVLHIAVVHLTEVIAMAWSFWRPGSPPTGRACARSEAVAIALS